MYFKGDILLGICLSLVLFLPIHCIASIPQANKPEYSVLLISDSLMENADVVIRRSNKHFVVKNPGRASLKFFIAQTILTPTSDYDKVYLHYDKLHKIGNIEAKVYDKHGVLLKTLAKSDIDDRSAYDGYSLYTDNRFKLLDLKTSQIPYTIEYSYEKEYNGIQHYPLWTPQDFGVSVELSNFEVSIPDAINIEFKQYGGLSDPLVNLANSKTIYTWECKNRPARGKEANLPYRLYGLPIVEIIPTKFKISNFEGDMSSWDSYAKFYDELNADRDHISDEMKESIRILVQEARTDAEKIEILYNYLQKEMRYVSVQLGIGGWQTFDASYVEENSYGDCKALTNFMKSMLSYIGINSNFALVYSGEPALPIDSIFSYPRFNHVVLHIPSESLWLECTSNISPFGYMGQGTEGKLALVVSETSGEIIRIPEYLKTFGNSSMTIKVLSSGHAEIRKTEVLTGRYQEQARYVHNYLSGDDQKEWSQNRLNIPNFNVENYKLNVSSKSPRVSVVTKGNSNSVGSKSGKRMFITLDFFDIEDFRFVQSKERVAPIFLRNNYNYRDTVVIEIPESYMIEHLLEDEVIDVPRFGEFSISSSVEENAIRVIRTLNVHSSDFAASESEELAKFFGGVSSYNKRKIVLIKNGIENDE